MSLSGFSYGEFIIYQNNIPKFYFSAFDDNDIIVQEAKKLNMPIGEYLSYLLKEHGIKAPPL